MTLLRDFPVSISPDRVARLDHLLIPKVVHSSVPE